MGKHYPPDKSLSNGSNCVIHWMVIYPVNSTFEHWTGAWWIALSSLWTTQSWTCNLGRKFKLRSSCWTMLELSQSSKVQLLIYAQSSLQIDHWLASGHFVTMYVYFPIFVFFFFNLLTSIKTTGLKVMGRFFWKVF